MGLRPVHLAAYKGFPRCLEHLIEHGADVNAPSPNGKAYGTLYMAARGVQDLLHKKYGKPPPPENALRRWLFTLVSSKPDDDAMKKRWCPVFEVLFRAGAEVRPDWRDDPFAGVAEDFHRSAPRPADEIRMRGEPESSLLDGPAYSRSLAPSPSPWAGARGGRKGSRPCQAIRLTQKTPSAVAFFATLCLRFYKL